MRVDEYDYHLPEELIAQTPLKERSTSKLLVLDKQEKTINHHIFSDIVDMLGENDCLVFNDTKVIPSRIYGTKKETNASIEVLLLKELETDTWEALTRPAKRVKIGTEIVFGDNQFTATCIGLGEDGLRTFKMNYEGIFLEKLEKVGEMPLPPYIHEKLQEQDRYQTVYAKYYGSAAAPTAGLYFTNEVLEKLKEKNVQMEYVTLHVGLGTFRPVKVEKVETHKMHSEYIEVTKESADIINECKKNGGRLICVGTTSCRVLESVSDESGKGDFFGPITTACVIAGPKEIKELFNIEKLDSFKMFEILETKEKHDEVEKIIDRYVNYLSVGLSDIINIFDIVSNINK